MLRCWMHGALIYPWIDGLVGRLGVARRYVGVFRVLDFLPGVVTLYMKVWFPQVNGGPHVLVEKQPQGYYMTTEQCDLDLSSAREGQQ